VPQNRTRSGTFAPGASGNPGGRPRGLARATRKLAGDDGQAIAEFWYQTMNDEKARTADRLEASRLLADRGWGKPSSEPLPDPQEQQPPQIFRPLTPERALELACLTKELMAADEAELEAPPATDPDPSSRLPA
jgi:hypothetical protein